MYTWTQCTACGESNDAGEPVEANHAFSSLVLHTVIYMSIESDITRQVLLDSQSQMQQD